MATMKAIQVTRAKGPFELVERPIPEPGTGEVRIKVKACGICHSDVFVKDGLWPGITYPRIPGHEVSGYVDKVGREVNQWNSGDRVGIGWHGGHCFQCELCRIGDFINCQKGKVAGISYDGGYAEYMVAPQEALARMPKGLDLVKSAPLMCAGVTTYNALRNSGARGGDLVAVQGLGGLGHLAVQYASSMGFQTVAISGGHDKEKLARELGAHHYINYRDHPPAEELKKLGGAQVILATAPNSQAISSLVDGLTPRGKLLIVAAASDPLEVIPLSLISGRMVTGWPSGHAKDAEDTLNFSALTGILPMVELFSLNQASAAYEQMISNKARFRVVLQVR
jgi:D-arabinose 1-dehydrogenase-like Zn-dependent alcohol dehydrogenase